MNKFAFIFAAVVAFATIFDLIACSSLEFKLMEQKLTHFNNCDSRYFPMRYLISKEFYQPCGPIFVHVGGESKLSAYDISDGRLIYDMAKNMGGMLSATELRFFGLSLPSEGITKENLKYLNMDEAAADLAEFLKRVKLYNDAYDSKIILVGCSYGGSLATFFKRRYKTLAAGVWASSAILLPLTEVEDAAQLRGDLIKKHGSEKCYNSIKNGIRVLEKMFLNGNKTGVEDILKLCKNGDKKYDLRLNEMALFQYIYILIAQFTENENARPHVIFPLHIPPYAMENVCSTIPGNGTDVDGLVNFIHQVFNRVVYPNTLKCYEMSYDSILKVISFAGSDYVSMFLKCNELGQFETFTDPELQPFGTKGAFEFYAHVCADLFGDQYNKRDIRRKIQKTNDRFANFDPDLENVYLTYGGKEYLNQQERKDLKSDVIPECHSCGDLNTFNDADSNELNSSKEKIYNLVELWLKQ